MWSVVQRCTEDRVLLSRCLSTCSPCDSRGHTNRLDCHGEDEHLWEDTRGRKIDSENRRQKINFDSVAITMGNGDERTLDCEAYSPPERLVRPPTRWSQFLPDVDVSMHGFFRAYLKKIGKAKLSNCEYCGAVRDDAEHTFFRCDHSAVPRLRLEIEVGDLTPEMVLHRKKIEENLVQPTPQTD